MPEPLTRPAQREFVSLSQLAEDILGLSRARVYELIERGALPMPVYDTRSRRPLFDLALQRKCIAVRETGVGCDGSAVIFYRRDKTASTPVASQRQPRQRVNRSAQSANAEIVTSLQALGVNADEQSVSAAIAQCFPNGTRGEQESDVIRAVFRLLRS